MRDRTSYRQHTITLSKDNTPADEPATWWAFIHDPTGGFHDVRGPKNTPDAARKAAEDTIDDLLESTP